MFVIATFAVFHNSIGMSSDELLLLSTRNFEQGNNERAIELLEQYKRPFQLSDPRSKDAAERIQEIKNKQLLMLNKTGQ
jgi:hypothetical protein